MLNCPKALFPRLRKGTCGLMAILTWGTFEFITFKILFGKQEYSSCNLCANELKLVIPIQYVYPNQCFLSYL